MTRLNETAKGVYVIAPTPFLPDGAIDTASIDTMVEAYIEAGADGLTIMGMMGEAQKLAPEEGLQVMRRVLERVRGRIPVVVGVSAPGLATITGLSAAAMEAGAAGVMVAPPGTLNTDGKILDYYRMVGEELGEETPFVLQDFPLVTGVAIASSVIDRIVQDVPTCVMLKHEDWPGLSKISALRRTSEAGGRRISILCGNGGLFLPEEIERGADGAMTGFAFPEMMIGVCRLMASGESAAARDLFDAYLPLIRYESQPGLGLAIRKHILARRGIIAHPTLRRPGPKLSPADVAEIDTLLERQTARLGHQSE
ncbi:dihydrodipicolinate synthase family protein [Pseudoroseicyclus tamaricis]|uniref:Dihydrodipicolinate synthase family protein n=1 Tax=Pseudoroseicyclus tamaricis TaxID=2705421 RepID=A0A6B2JQX7_9RHOB|nr:dihydrodipicolinate synthase family protein [Pseudoroseicyclus tamaricis]NDV00568.1 dihydrodipicolinate synthase family protein [Pseudoroseicyclus tamaricis]